MSVDLDNLVYVVVVNNGYEGYSKPLGIFRSRKWAESLKVGAGCYRTVEILEYILEELYPDTPGQE